MIGLVLALALTAFFGVRTAAFYAHIQAPKPHVIEPWMRPHYIARAFKLNYDEVLDALGLDEDDPRRKLSIAQIAKRANTDRSELIAEIEALIDKRTEEQRP